MNKSTREFASITLTATLFAGLIVLAALAWITPTGASIWTGL